MELKILYQENNKLKTTLIKESSNILMPKNIIKIEKIRNIDNQFYNYFSSYDEVVDMFEELSLILSTNLSLSQSVDILLQGNTNTKIQEVLISIKNALENAKPIHQALEEHKSYIGTLPILFFKLGIQNANINDSIKALCIILSEKQKAKKKFISALSYPIFLTIVLFLSVVVIFNFVLPQLLSSFRNIPRHQ